MHSACADVAFAGLTGFAAETGIAIVRASTVAPSTNPSLLATCPSCLDDSDLLLDDYISGCRHPRVCGVFSAGKNRGDRVPESRQLVTEPTRPAGEARVFLRAVRGGGREVGAAASAVVARGGDVGFRSARGRRGGGAARPPPRPVPGGGEGPRGPPR